MGGMRKIAAILVADIVGYSRLAGTDEDRTLSRLRGLRSDLIDPAVHTPNTQARPCRIPLRSTGPPEVGLANWSELCWLSWPQLAVQDGEVSN